MTRSSLRFPFLVAVFLTVLIHPRPTICGDSFTFLDHPLDLSNAVVLFRGEKAPPIERTAVTVLVEEVKKRTGIEWEVVNEWPSKPSMVVAIVSGSAETLLGQPVPVENRETRPEGYTLAYTEPEGNRKSGVIWICGADAQGTLYGIGKLLRSLSWREGRVDVEELPLGSTAPQDSIRGHQLGYRTTANSYDAWTPEQYDQYIRELTFFGANAVENIPFQDQDSPVMPVSRQQMNRELGRICQKYGVQYWVWTPATIDLTDPEKRADLLRQHEAFYKDCTHLDAVFFPGGDPGNNHPKDVLPFLEDVSVLLNKYHPGAKVWMSLQNFEEDEVDYFFDWISQHQPDWFEGAVGGPSSPPLSEIRRRLPRKYKLRDYPDITHTVRSQYPTPWLDPAFAFTSGREGTNPEPVYYSTIFRAFDQYTDGFITYSDGVHDDVNKTVWSVLGWDAGTDIRDALIEYCRLFFGPDVAERAADGLFALERNWAGPLRTNGGVEATLALWQELERLAPWNAENWRWQFCQLKAHYDAYIRARLIREEKLEDRVNRVLAEAPTLGAEQAMDTALEIFAEADDRPVRPQLRKRVYDLCDDLFQSIGYQSSVEKYHANRAERSAVLDFLDLPLNNRWWYEDQFAEIRKLDSEQEKLNRLDILCKWENPGPGSFYDDIGNVAKSDRVIRGESIATDPMMIRNPNPDFMWWDDGRSRLRRSWISKMDWPIGLRYDGLDPDASYRIRTTGYGQCLLRADGDLLKPVIDGKDVGEIKEFVIPRDKTEDGTLIVTFDVPHEPGVNWRKASRLSEVWLIEQESGDRPGTP